MSEVTSLSPTVEIGEHLDFLYGEVEGWVYAPTKDPKQEDPKKAWGQNYYEWPRQRAEIIRHCESLAGTHEVYIGPALYKKPSGKKEDVKGTYVYWTEFDGQQNATAAVLADLPAASRRVRSSEEGHEHVYWRLDSFQTDIERIETANRALAYGLGADSSAWDANQVLRPPGTYNHKRSKPVLTVFRSDTKISATVFESYEGPKQVVSDIQISSIPDTLDVVAKYQWAPEDFEFFRKHEIPEGKRSSALTRLALTGCEMGMSDTEIFALLFNADERWGKFKGRRDREKRLLELINYARNKLPREVMPSDEEFPVFGWESFLAADIHVEWVITDLLQRAGFLLLSGPPGTGKTQISLRFAINMALGKPFLGYTAGEPIKIVIFSMEMGHADLKYFASQMAATLTPEEQKLLQENLKIIPLGYGVLLDQKAEQKKVEDTVAKLGVGGVFFDSLGSTTTDELSDEATVKRIMDWNDRFRAESGCFTWYIHHNRKAQVNNKKPNKLSDVYGNQYITARATTVLGLWPQGDDIEVSALKLRLSKLFEPYQIRRVPGLDFTRSQPGAGLVSSIQKEQEKESTEEESKPDDPQSFMGF